MIYLIHKDPDSLAVNFYTELGKSLIIASDNIYDLPNDYSMKNKKNHNYKYTRYTQFI